ncbi:MAG: tetratricopeptide repeat protein [Polyangiaceae bacterium]|nr:tetratricopeptide repeat protein [Polyangiaceae bacterium]
MSKRNKSDDDKVIHVVFGPGGGRVEAPSADGSARAHGVSGSYDLGHLPEEADVPRSGREPVSDLFSLGEVSRLLGLSTGRLRSLDKNGVVEPSGRRRGRRAYTFQDLIALRAARDLLAKKVRLRDVARAIESIRCALPRVTRPLAELTIISDGRQVVLKSEAGNYEPISGQMILDFEVKSLRDDVVRVLRPSAGRARAKTAYDLYVRASQLDEDPSTVPEAEDLYRRAIELDPWLAIAYTNLGNICFRRGEEDRAVELYRRALMIDVAQPEAQYNLGYVMLERGNPGEAIEFFNGAIKSDPRFADAYFNLAMAYEQTGKAEQARPCWRKYLEIEPTGTWADIARRHL